MRDTCTKLGNQNIPRILLFLKVICDDDDDDDDGPLFRFQVRLARYPKLPHFFSGNPREFKESKNEW